LYKLVTSSTIENSTRAFCSAVKTWLIFFLEGGNVPGRDAHGIFFEMVMLRLLHLAGKLLGL
jgi:hypothetical protein